MGTSVSFRSPNRPSWNAVIARIIDGDDPKQVQAELFNAGALDGWDVELGRGAVGSYVEALVDAHESFGDALTEAAQPTDAVQNLVDSVRRRALAEEGAPGVAFAERAFARTLLGTLQQTSSAGSSELTEQWSAASGSPSQLVQRFLGEVLAQYSRHVIARDAGRLLGRPGFEKASSVRRLERELGRQAGDVSSQVTVQGSGSELVASWGEYVRDAFRLASALPKSDG